MSRLAGCLLLALAAGAGGAPPPPGTPPEIRVLNGIDGGSILPGRSGGRLTLQPSPLPRGTRLLSGPLAPGASGSFALGRITLSGPPGHDWRLSWQGGGTLRLLDPRRRGGAFAFHSVELAPGDRQGTFPATPGPAATSPDLFLGLTVEVDSGSHRPPGLYSGAVSMTIRDETSNQVGNALVPVTLVLEAPPLALVQEQPLSFGDILAGHEGGRVTVRPGGERTSEEGVKLGLSAASHPAAVLVTGAENGGFVIVLPQAPVMLLGPPGSAPMRVDAFTCEPGRMGSLGEDGQERVKVGATLHVGTDQMPGAYAGSFPVTVSYD